MGYRIDYDSRSKRYEISTVHPWRFSFMMAVFLGIILLFLIHLRPEYATLIRSAMIPGDDTVTVQAIHNLTDDLRSGAAVSDALEAFCKYVIHER